MGSQGHGPLRSAPRLAKGQAQDAEFPRSCPEPQVRLRREFPGPPDGAPRINGKGPADLGHDLVDGIGPLDTDELVVEAAEEEAEMIRVQS